MSSLVRWVRPYYLSVDVSRSTARTRSATMDVLVPALLNVLEEQDRSDEPALLSVVEFAGRARVLTRLERLAGLSHVPEPSSDGDTSSFSDLFGLLRERITSDVRALEAERTIVARPVVLLVTDGQGTDAWETRFESLTEYDPLTDDGFPWYPFVVPIGVPGCDLSELAAFAFPRGICRAVGFPADGSTDRIVAALELASGRALPCWAGSDPASGVDVGVRVVDDFA